MSLDENSANAIASDIIAALKAVEEKHGVKITNNGGRYGSDHFDMKIKINTLDESGKVNHFAKEADAFRRNAPFIDGVNIDDLHRVIRHQGDKLVIVGYNTRAKKFPFLLQHKSDFDANNTSYLKAPEGLVINALAHA